MAQSILFRMRSTCYMKHTHTHAAWLWLSTALRTPALNNNMQNIFAIQIIDRLDTAADFARLIICRTLAKRGGANNTFWFECETENLLVEISAV